MAYNIAPQAQSQGTIEHGIDAGLKLHPPGEDTGKHVAVIGAGPAGLSVAYQLRRKGHAVTIYDFNEKPGGMMLYGVMAYRVERSVLEAEVGKILDLGIELKMGVRIGKDISLEKLEEDFDAVFIGVGAQSGRNLPIKGFSETNGTTNAIEFLRSYEIQGDSFKIGKKVIVIGDGNVAMDVARLARRMGSESTIISAVPREEMNCYPDEFDDAIEEGAKVEYLTGTLEILGNKNGADVIYDPVGGNVSEQALLQSLKTSVRYFPMEPSGRDSRNYFMQCPFASRYSGRRTSFATMSTHQLLGQTSREKQRECNRIGRHQHTLRMP